jgi:hypothetical protein
VASSFRENLYQRPNLAITGTEIPEYLRRVLPPYANNPPVILPRDPNNPFGDPPHFHEVDPPNLNPYNDPDYNPNFLVTQNPLGQVGDEPGGGLLVVLRALHDGGPPSGIDVYGNYSPETRVAKTYAIAPQEFQATPQKKVRYLSRRPAG